MSQINRYIVEQVGAVQDQELNSKDRVLITSYSLGNVPFLLDKYELKADFYTLDGTYIETISDLKTYKVLGVNQGSSATEISVDPVQDSLDNGYLGDIQVEYKVTNNIFSPTLAKDSEAVLFVREISTDRTEIRTTSTTLSEVDIQNYAQQLYQKLNEQAYFKGVDLNFFDDHEIGWCLNVMTEVLDGDLVVAFKLYDPLPDQVTVKSRFTVEEQIGKATRYQVTRTVEIVEDEVSVNQLKGPNFDIVTAENPASTVTGYLNYNELFSYPDLQSRSELYSIFNQQGIELSVDHSDLANFIHFSSAVERLENFRYKLTLIKEYQSKADQAQDEGTVQRYQNLIQGIIDNFDHYDRYLYYNNEPTCWPKKNNNKPYVNLDPESEEAQEWFKVALVRARNYDENNPDILINTIPEAIRQDSRNEPYLVFIHMIGQHFDEEWLYAKALSERYNGDNRLNFGISKDLVREALRSFGVEMLTTNQNLESLFELCVPGKPYNVGSELSVTTFKRATIDVDGHNQDLPVSQSIWNGELASWSLSDPNQTIDGYLAFWNTPAVLTADAGRAVTEELLEEEAVEQPIYIEDYRKEIYKRIYHNIPLLLKTKGTNRGLRALVACFGIPSDILDISVQGSANSDNNQAFFGPETETTSSAGRIRLDNTGSRASQMFKLEGSVGSFISGTTLAEDRELLQRKTHYSRGYQEAEIGFRLNKQFDEYVKSHVSNSFDYDDIVGDPRNIGENYGTAFNNILYNIEQDLSGSYGIPVSSTGLKQGYFRSPAAILRLVRYFDSALFRTLQSFVSARDNVVAGAIVDDNLLHRNRYVGVKATINPGSEFVGKWAKTGSAEPKWTEDITGSIETVFIDGGEAGCLKVLKGRRINTANPNPLGQQTFYLKAVSPSAQRTFVTVSHEYPSVNYMTTQPVGSEYITETIFDDSPRFTGELEGTVKEVTDGELTADNIFRKGGSSTKELTYILDLRYLCLPRRPISCTLQAVGATVGYVCNATGVENVELINYSIGSLSPVTIWAGSEIVLCEDEPASILARAINGYMFTGWYVGEIEEATNYIYDKYGEGISQDNVTEYLGTYTTELNLTSTQVNQIIARNRRVITARHIPTNLVYRFMVGNMEDWSTFRIFDIKDNNIPVILDSSSSLYPFISNLGQYSKGETLHYLYIKDNNSQDVDTPMVFDIQTGELTAEYEPSIHGDDWYTFYGISEEGTGITLAGPTVIGAGFSKIEDEHPEVSVSNLIEYRMKLPCVYGMDSSKNVLGLTFEHWPYTGSLI